MWPDMDRQDERTRRRARAFGRAPGVYDGGVIEEATAVPAGTVVVADLCIIGAGAAGIAIARALRGRGLDIVVLESGGFAADAATTALSEGAIVGEQLRFLEFPLDLTNTRLRFFGGTTNHWMGWSRPLDASDFLARSHVPDSGWPFGRDVLDPYLKEAQELIELSSLGFEPADWAPFGAAAPVLATELVETTMFQYSPPTRFAETYRADLADAGDVRVLLHANAIELDSTPAGDHVTGVEVATLDGIRWRVEARAYVLAVGAIEGARLLLASNRVVPDGLGNAAGLVGRYYMDHPHLFVGRAVMAASPDELDLYRRRPYRVPTAAGDRDIEALGVFRLTGAAQAAHGTTSILAIPEVKSVEDAVASGPQGGHFATTEQIGEAVGAMGGAPIRSVIDFFTMSEQFPNPESRVRLGEERDELGVRRVELDWRVTDRDRRTVQVGLEVIGAELGRLGLGRMLVEEEGEGPMVAPVSTGPHHMGTLRMAADPARGVVDPDSRVHGIDDLFVAGSAVYPTGGAANPTLTLLALGLRLADHLSSRALE